MSPRCRWATSAKATVPPIWGASAAVVGGVARRMRYLLAESDTEISAGVRSSASHGVAEVKRPGALHHEGVLEHDVAADELAEVADAGAEQHRHLADAELVDEAEVERLLDDVGAGDRDELVAGELLCRRDRLLDAAREGRPREPLCRVLAAVDGGSRRPLARRRGGCRPSRRSGRTADGRRSARRNRT